MIRKKQFLKEIVEEKKDDSTYCEDSKAVQQNKVHSLCLIHLIEQEDEDEDEDSSIYNLSRFSLVVPKAMKEEYNINYSRFTRTPEHLLVI